jgi:hypothetical protein
LGKGISLSGHVWASLICDKLGANAKRVQNPSLYTTHNIADTHKIQSKHIQIYRIIWFSRRNEKQKQIAVSRLAIAASPAVKFILTVFVLFIPIEIYCL